MSDDEMYEEELKEFRSEMKKEAEEYDNVRYELEDEARLEWENEVLDSTIRDAEREDCYADYSGSREPHMECTYHTDSSSSSFSWKNWAASLDGTFWGVVFVIALTIPFAILILKPKKRKKK